MKSVTNKISTHRRAVATGRVTASPESIRRLTENDLPKKDVLAVARVAAVTAAKKTPDMIPYCHPLPIDSVDVSFDVGTDRIDITAAVEAVAKTGVEMEALTAVSAAALTVYDMLKPIDTTIEIERIRLDSKRGGKTDFTETIPKGFKAAVIVTSDGVYEGTREDRSGKVVCKKLSSYGLDPLYEIIPDEKDEVAKTLRRLIGDQTDLILTTGGTGLGPRDVTVEATREVIEREIPGVAEAARAYGQRRTPYAMLSRGLAGVCGRTVIVNLPGSSRGAEETMNAILPGLFHVYGMLRGKGH